MASLRSALKTSGKGVQLPHQQLDAVISRSVSVGRSWKDSASFLFTFRLGGRAHHIK